MSKLDDAQATPEMSLQDHIADLRKAIIRSLLSVAVFFGISVYYADVLLTFLKQPLLEVLTDHNVPAQLHFTGPMDVVIASLKVAFLSSLVVGSPFWTYHLWQFVKPGLYPKERRLILPYALASMVLFLLGVGLCYLVILPMSLNFLIGFGTQVGTPIITINDYLSLVILLLLAFGFVFETPMVLVFLASLGLVSAQSLRDYRSFVIVGIFIIAAILTPPDPISQIAMAVPLLILYELSILVISWVFKNSN